MATVEEAKNVPCPACNAMPGHPCTAPTDTDRKLVGWVHMAREVMWDHANEEKADFYLTFGIQYYEETHPRWPECNPKGYVRITAGTYEQARMIAVNRFGLDWSMLTPAPHFNRDKFPAGEVMVLP
jgi:hypothetical protein